MHNIPTSVNFYSTIAKLSYIHSIHIKFHASRHIWIPKTYYAVTKFAFLHQTPFYKQLTESKVNNTFIHNTWKRLRARPRDSIDFRISWCLREETRDESFPLANFINIPRTNLKFMRKRKCTLFRICSSGYNLHFQF